MCGIVVGLCFGKLNKKDEEIRQKLLRYFTTELMILTEERGKDATGAAILFNDGEFCGIKRGERVTDFLARFGESKDYYGSLLKIWRECEIERAARIFLGHCRQGTIGDKEENENNHPIKVGNLVGIHNGVIKNHDTIFQKLGCKRDGKVDSEAIFRLFEHFTNGGKEPFTLDMCQEVVNRLDGQFAVSLFNADNLEQVPIFRDGRPVELVLIKSYGIVFAISDNKFWKEVLYHYERLVHYNPELFGRSKMPSLITPKDNIDTKIMEDDSAVIFDLAREVTDKTKLEDLGEGRKMSRVHKIWQATTTTTAYSRKDNNYNYHNKSTHSTTTGSTGTEKKRRVFDNITRQYVVKVGDKVVEDTQPVILPIDEEEDDKDKKLVTGSATVVTRGTEDELKSTDKAEEQPGQKATIDDSTDYDKHDKTNATIAAVREAITMASEAGVDDDIIDVDCSVIEVDIVPTDPKMIEEAEKAYKDLPEKDRGYTDLEEVLDDISIKDVETMLDLGELVLCNRVKKAGWKAGYIAALKKNNSKDKDTEDKDRKREKHIAQLKCMVLVLSKFYNGYLGNNPSEEVRNFVQKKLAAAAVDANIDVPSLVALFNAYEKPFVQKVGVVVSKAQKDTQEMDHEG